MVRLIFASVLGMMGVWLTVVMAADATKFSPQEIATMHRSGVKMALPGQEPPYIVPLTITQAQLVETEVLDFSVLSLTRLPDWVARFTKLKNLNLKGVGLQMVPLAQLQQMPKLQILDLSDNPRLAGSEQKLASLWAHLPNLHILKLANTGGDAAVYGDFSGLAKLNELDLSHNAISTITPLGLASLAELRKLSLSHNLLTAFDPRQVSHPVLARLDLSHNQLQTIPFDVDLPELKWWDLSGNPGVKLADGYGDTFTVQNLVLLPHDSNAVLPPPLSEKLEVWRKKDELMAEQERQSACLASTATSPRKAGEIGTAAGITLVWVPGGHFQMGDPGGQHGVCIRNGFWMGQTEVTFAQWDACVTAGGCQHKPEDQGWGRDNRPVINVSWDDITVYLRWLNTKIDTKTGQQFRLPSEAEWEYAARAGTKTAYWWGDTASHEYMNYGSDSCCSGLASGRDQWEHTAPVGSFPVNPWGLFDMHGNVWEWCADSWHGNYDGAPTDGSVWAGDGAYRVLRGGSWLHSPRNALVAFRDRNSPDLRRSRLGFRLVLGAPGQK